MKFVKVLFLLCLAVTATTSFGYEQHGSLKVTSFPEGASVSIDGAPTGKITPMSIGLSAGAHTVVVSIPNSGWQTATRSVTVVAGDNSLRVVLLPILTILAHKGQPGLSVRPGHRARRAIRERLERRAPSASQVLKVTWERRVIQEPLGRKV